MPRYQPNGRIAVIHCPSVADISAPTVAELTAGTKFAKHMTRDGLNIPLSSKTIDTADAGSDYNSTEVGTWGGDPGTYTAYKYSLEAEDEAWNTLQRLESGVWVVAPNGFGVDANGFGSEENTPVAGERCMSYPMRVSIAVPQPLKADTADMVVVTFAIPTAPNLYAVVAA